MNKRTESKQRQRLNKLILSRQLMFLEIPTRDKPVSSFYIETNNYVCQQLSASVGEPRKLL